MDCLPLDDACHINYDRIDMIIDAENCMFVNVNSFSLGIFNGRSHTYTWFDESPVILIENVSPVKDDAFPPDVLGDW